jgi:hypothetical protein
MDKLCMAYLRRGEGELPGGARLRVEAYVTALRARFDASERVRVAAEEVVAASVDLQRAGSASVDLAVYLTALSRRDASIPALRASLAPTEGTDAAL